jgi:hypothetical protein
MNTFTCIYEVNPERNLVLRAKLQQEPGQRDTTWNVEVI